MKPLIVLITTSVIAFIVLKLFNHQYDFCLAGRIGMSCMLLFTCIGHFAFTKGMAMMVPANIPYKTGIVYLTGIMEIIAATTLLIPAFTGATGWFLIAFFIILMPANFYASVKRVNYQKGDYSGPGLNYLWFRIPLQLLFIAWVYFSSISCWQTSIL